MSEPSSTALPIGATPIGDAPENDPRALVPALRDAADTLLVGQEEAKQGLLLALLAAEHAYLEGPPGCGKSRLAEGMARLVGSRPHVLAFHRDVRDVDLLGDAVLRRTRTPRGERLAVDVAPGPLLRSSHVVLEDLPRAPGQALGPLLRILAERQALGQPLPLESAIATAPALADDADCIDAPIDPLEPGQLDRFTVQVRLRGLLQQQRWGSARSVLEATAMESEQNLEQIEAVLDDEQRRRLQWLGRGLAIDDAVPQRYRQWLDQMRLRLAAVPAGASLLSDRTFGRGVFRLFRAHAILRGAERVEVGDLRALRFVLARRVPEELQEEAQHLIEEVIRQPPEVQHGGGVAVPTLGSGEEADSAPGAESVPAGDDPGDAGEIAAAPPTVTAAAARRPADVTKLLEAFSGRIDRGRIDQDGDPGGQPRSYRPLQRLDELLDGDLVEAMLYVQARLPGRPRCYRRLRRNAGGAVVILRDVSSSMAGERHAWAADVVDGLVAVAARRRMRVGYVEFHHRALPRPVAGRLLHRGYRHLVELCHQAHPLGQTNYQEPLAVALETLQGKTGRNRHVVLLTDGLPITGDTRVRAERALAQRLGVALHTVYLGDGDCPTVLDDISRETGGLRFLTRAETPTGGLEVCARA